MNLGFVGTGAITAAIVTGLSSAGLGSADDARYCIRLSPRNLEIAADLARRFPGVSTASSNQEVLDSCETVVIAVRPQVVQSVLSELRFRSDHHVISVVSGLSLRKVSELTAPAAKVTRALPLPSTAKRRGPTAIYPPDGVVVDLFAKLGTAFEIESESEFEALCAATATVASYFSFADSIATWLVKQGVPQAKAREYLAQMFLGLANTALEEPERSFQSLAADHATRGGINEQVVAHLRERGVFENVSEALDAVMRRITSGSSSS